MFNLLRIPVSPIWPRNLESEYREVDSLYHFPANKERYTEKTDNHLKKYNSLEGQNLAQRISVLLILKTLPA